MARKEISSGLRFKVLSRDSFTCQYCGRSAPEVVLHVDHVIPVSKGGTNDIRNLVTACEACNLGKSNIELMEASESDKRALRERIRNIDRLNSIVSRLEGSWCRSRDEAADER